MRAGAQEISDEFWALVEPLVPTQEELRDPGGFAGKENFVEANGFTSHAPTVRRRKERIGAQS